MHLISASVHIFLKTARRHCEFYTCFENASKYDKNYTPFKEISPTFKHGRLINVLILWTPRLRLNLVAVSSRDRDGICNRRF